MLRAGQSDPAIKIEAFVKVDGGCPARTGTRQQGAFGTEPSPWAMQYAWKTSACCGSCDSENRWWRNVLEMDGADGCPQ